MATTIQGVRDGLESDGPTLFYDGEQTLLFSFAHLGQLMAVTISHGGWEIHPVSDSLLSGC